MNKYLLVGVVALLIIAGGWWYLNQSSAPLATETAQLPTLQETTNAQTQAAIKPSVPATPQSQNSSDTLFSHPTDGYSFSYDSTKLEARTSSATDTEFPQDTGLKSSSVVTSGGGYVQEVEILTYQGTMEAAQEAFVGAYKKYYSPQVLGTENVTINGNSARIVMYKIAPTGPEAIIYLIANGPRTIVATGDYDVIASIKTR